MQTKTPIDVEKIQRAVLRVRSQNVLLDSDLAALYGVEVKVLNQAVRRNKERFPADFMFQLNANEAASLRSQIVTANARRGGRRTAPYAFTEQGVAMLSSVLRSPWQKSCSSSRKSVPSRQAFHIRRLVLEGGYGR